jgi:hypothetical protein
MDPNEALRQIRVIVADVLEGNAPEPPPDIDVLAELIDGLDGWLVKGGALPSAWTATQETRK